MTDKEFINQTKFSGTRSDIKSLKREYLKKLENRYADIEIPIKIQGGCVNS